MRVIIIGAGKVGYNIASALSKEMYDVIVIDNDEEVSKRLMIPWMSLLYIPMGLLENPLVKLVLIKMTLL